METREELLKKEEINIRHLGLIVDLAQAALMRSGLTMEESLGLIENTKRAALGLFPDKEFVYDLVYTPRFRRIIAGRFTIPGTYSGRN